MVLVFWVHFLVFFPIEKPGTLEHASLGGSGGPHEGHRGRGGGLGGRGPRHGRGRGHGRGHGRGRGGGTDEDRGEGAFGGWDFFFFLGGGEGWVLGGV